MSTEMTRTFRRLSDDCNQGHVWNNAECIGENKSRQNEHKTTNLQPQYPSKVVFGRRKQMECTLVSKGILPNKSKQDSSCQVECNISLSRQITTWKQPRRAI